MTPTALAGVSGPLLTTLELAEWKLLRDDDLRVVAARAPNLKRVSLLRCPSISDAGFEAIAAGCLGLRDVVLRGSGWAIYGAPALSDRSLIALGAHCKCGGGVLCHAIADPTPPAQSSFFFPGLPCP